jgi:hypothetical protein
MRKLFKDAVMQRGLETDGYVVLDFLNAEELDSLRLHAAWRPDDISSLPFSSSLMSNDTDYKIKASDAILSAFNRSAEGYFYKSTLFFGTFMTKLGAAPASQRAWHQDPSLVDESQFSGLTIWCPLVDTTEENGALEVLAGSHRLNLFPRPLGVRFPYEHLLPAIEEQKTILPMKSGQAFIGYDSLFHYSPPNQTNQTRVAALAIVSNEASMLSYGFEQRQGTDPVLTVFEVEPAHFRTKMQFRMNEGDGYRLKGTIPYTHAVLNEADILLNRHEINS